MKSCEDCGGTSFELTRSGRERCTECGLMICVDCGEGVLPRNGHARLLQAGPHQSVPGLRPQERQA